jgi:hypothetical protein
MTTQPAKRATVCYDPGLPPARRAVVFQSAALGVPLRSTTGFALSPAPRIRLDFGRSNDLKLGQAKEWLSVGER